MQHVHEAHWYIYWPMGENFIGADSDQTAAWLVGYDTNEEKLMRWLAEGLKMLVVAGVMVLSLSFNIIK